MRIVVSRRLPVRVLLLLVLALLSTAALAVQPALTSYQARLGTLKAQIPAVTASAQQAAERILAHPGALLNVPYYEQMGFAEEMRYRAGGLALVGPTNEWGNVPTRYDVVLLSVRSWESQAALIRRRVKEYHAQGWAVTVIGSKAGRPAELGADFFLDNGAPTGKTDQGRINVPANITLGWMWCCEYAAAMSRKGKFPAILHSILMPGAQAYDLVLETADGRHILFDCPTAIPAGQLASAYLKRIDTLVRDLQSAPVQGQVTKAAGIIAERLAKGGRLGVAGMGHVILEDVKVDHRTPWIAFRVVGMSDISVKANLRPGDLLLYLAYCGMNTPYEDYAKGIAEAKVDLITCYAPDPVWAKDPPKTPAHIDQSWSPPDAEVPIPVFPYKMAPVSGVNVTLLLRMLDDEVADRLQKINAHPAAPAQTISPRVCERIGSEVYFDEMIMGHERQWGFVDMTGKEVAPQQYEEIGLGQGLVSVREKGKWGYIDKTGKMVIPPAFEVAGNFANGVALVRADGKFGLIDATGKPVIPAQYDSLSWPQQNPYLGYLIAHTEKGWSLIDRTGKELLPPKYDRLFGFTGNKVIFQQGGKFGLVTTTGQEVIPAKYEVIGSYGGNGASVRQDGRWGMINDGGTEIVPPKYEEIGAVSGNLVVVRTGNLWGVVTRDGVEVLPPKYDEIKAFNGGVAQARLGKLWGFIATDGKEMVPPQFDAIGTYASEGLYPVELQGKWGYADIKGTIIIPAQFDSVDQFGGRLAVVQLDGAWRLIDKQGAEVLKTDYDYLVSAYNGLYKTVRGGKWGVIDKTGKEIVPPKYSYIMQFYGNRALVASGGAWREGVGKPMLAGAKWGIIDSNGAEIIPPQYDWIYPWGNELVPVAHNVELLTPQP